MKILHIASGDFFSTYGGGQVYVKNIVDWMINEGHDVVVLSFVKSSNNSILKDYKGKELYETSLHCSELELEEIISKTAPDVIHAHSNKALICRIGERMNIPVVVTSHHGGILCPAGTRLNCKDEICHSSVSHRNCLPCVLRNTRAGLKLWYPFMRHLSEKTYDNLGKWLKAKPFIPFLTPVGTASTTIKSKLTEWNEIAEKCSMMVAPCDEIAQAMIQNGLDPDKVKVIPHGIPLPEERPPYPEVKDGKIKFYYVGRICYVKGIHTLLEAFSKVDNAQIELHLIGGAGNKQEARYMSDLQKRHPNDKRITWHGKIAPEAVFEATRNYHVSSSAAFLEAFGLNIAEALALGKPVLATRSGGAEMQIEDGVNGWLVPTNDVDACAEKIRYIIAHPEILPEMSMNCHAISIQKHCQALNELYSKLLKTQ